MTCLFALTLHCDCSKDTKISDSDWLGAHGSFSTHLSEAVGLPDEEEVEVPEVLGHPGAGDVGQRRHLDVLALADGALEGEEKLRRHAATSYVHIVTEDQWLSISHEEHCICWHNVY